MADIPEHAPRYLDGKRYQLMANGHLLQRRWRDTRAETRRNGRSFSGTPCQTQAGQNKDGIAKNYTVSNNQYLIQLQELPRDTFLTEGAQ